jgi:hypothetical protein
MNIKTNDIKNETKKNTPKIWNETEVKLLKKWGEQAASYRVLHNNAYRKYKTRNIYFTLPVIIMSTMTGTANFSQGTISEIYPECDIYLPLIIGALNLLAGIITTIAQFLRVSELMESNRNSSICYGKFARNISTELSLPPLERTYNGIDYILICRNEMDRLIEQSPEIAMKTLRAFEKDKRFKHIIRPEIINISEIEVYKPTKKEVISQLVGNETEKFKERLIKKKLESNKILQKDNSNTHTTIELADIRGKGIVKNFPDKLNDNLHLRTSSNETSEEDIILGNPVYNKKVNEDLKKNLKYLNDNNYLGSSMYQLNTKDFNSSTNKKNKLQKKMSKTFKKSKSIFEINNNPTFITNESNCIDTNRSTINEDLYSNTKSVINTEDNINNKNEISSNSSNDDNSMTNFSLKNNHIVNKKIKKLNINNDIEIINNNKNTNENIDNYTQNNNNNVSEYDFSQFLSNNIDNIENKSLDNNQSNNQENIDPTQKKITDFFK